MIIFNKKILQHIPKTSGTAIKAMMVKNADKLEYVTNHKPLSFLYENSSLDKYKEYPVYAILRNPYKWHESWYNFTIKLKRNCPIITVIKKYTNSMYEYVEAQLDLTKFFHKHPKALDDMVEHILYNSYSHFSYFLYDLKELSAEYFKNKSIYEYYLDLQIDDNVSLFRYEYDLMAVYKEFDLDTNDIIYKNVTHHDEIFNSKILKLIEKEEQKIFRLYDTIK